MEMTLGSTFLGYLLLSTKTKMLMNKNFYTLTLFFICFLLASVNAQDTSVPKDSFWTTGAGIGLDFSQLFQLNPKQGAGQNRLGFGGAINAFAKYKKDCLAWDNVGAWQFGVQRLGAGVLAQGTETSKIPFQKAIDQLRLGSKLGYQSSENSKWFYAADFTFLSQLTSTYPGTDEYPGNFLTSLEDGIKRNSALFAPATITLSLGMDYKPNDNFSLYLSPLGAKFIIVSDDDIAALGVHGNPVERDADGNIISFENVDSQLGAVLRANFTDKFYNDRLAFTSGLTLYSNYLRNPQNIDVDWTNEFAIEIFKGLQLAVTVNIFYDDDVRVQITDYDALGGVSGLGKRVSLTQQLLIKYNLIF
jgi:hypothetical protein